MNNAQLNTSNPAIRRILSEIKKLVLTHTLYSQPSQALRDPQQPHSKLSPTPYALLVSG